jgi:hypothetical protein
MCGIHFDPKNKKWLASNIFMILTLDCEIEVFFARFMCDRQSCSVDKLGR